MAWEENSRICLHMQLIAILSRIGVILITLHQIIINYINMANLKRIKVVLVEKGKTGKWLAEEIGKTPCTVSKWCSNSIQPDLTTLDKIARLLNVDVKDLLNSTEQIDNIH